MQGLRDCYQVSLVCVEHVLPQKRVHLVQVTHMEGEVFLLEEFLRHLDLRGTHVESKNLLELI